MTQDNPTAPEGERRLVTILFADLVGYTSASESRDPELIQETLTLCFERLGEEIRRHGGYVDKIIGDAIMALFGAPRAQEDDAGKAIAAGLAMQRAVEELVPQVEDRLGQRFHLRVGINTGLVVTGAVGPGAYTVTGDAVNVASRLESNAPHGGVLVGDTTRRLARRQFIWGERRELTVKNRVEPVVCYTADAPGTSLLRLVPAPSDTPFVGRTALLDRLRMLWSGTADQRVVDIVGEAGIGKTRFLAHFFAEAGVSADQVIYARADTPPRTFGPLLQLLPSLRPSLPEALAKQLDLLAGAGDSPDDVTLSQDWLVEGLEYVLRALAARAPVALVLDDVHRADDATIDVVERLLPRIAGVPVLVLLLRQPVGRRARRLVHPESIAFEPLDDAEAGGLVRAAGPRLDEQAVASIVAQAGGNPLYLEVLATALAARGPGARGVPDTLQAAIVARIDDLDETSRQVLREASVFGQSFLEEPFRLTTTASESGYDALANLCAAGLLDEAPRGNMRGYQFRHSLVQQVLYEGLLRRRREALHLRAGEALELVHEQGQEVEPEEIAHHFERAGDTPRAANYHLASADRADRLRASGEARQHRRAASRMLSMASLADLYGGQRRASLRGRMLAAGMQIALAALLVVPSFLLLSLRRPDADALTLGLPVEIVEFNASSILLAVAIGGVPLLLAGVLYSHVAAPVLMRRHVAASTYAIAAATAWVLALGFVLIGYAILIVLMRYGLLDRLSSIYVGAATLQLLLGDRSMIVVVAGGALPIAIAWTVLLRLQAGGWMRQRRAAISPRQLEEARRWAAIRQGGGLLGIAAAGSALVIVAYQFHWLPNSQQQDALPTGIATLLIAIAAAAAMAGVVLAAWGRARLRLATPSYRPGLFGFEVPLVSALAFGLVVWFGMRQAVVVSANDVDTPGDVGQYSRAVDLFPDFGLAYYLRGERHLAESGRDADPTIELEAALSDFNRAAELDAAFPATYLARGRVYVALGRFEEALADGDRLADLRPAHPGGYAIRALAHANLGNLAAAGADLELATRPLPDNLSGWDAYFVRCLSLAAVQRFDEAEGDCERVIEVNPDQLVALDQLVLIADQRGDNERMLQYVDRMLAIDDSNYKTWANRGLANRALGNYADAVSDLTRALELNPNDFIAYRERALSLLYLDRIDEAMADADAGVALDEGERFTRLFVARYADDPASALADATALLDSEGDQSANRPYLYSARGLAKVLSGDEAGGLADLDEALRLDAERGSIYDRRGYAKFVAGDFAGAGADFDEALRRLSQLSPQGRAELHYHRALFLEAQGEVQQALAEADEALSTVQIPVIRGQIEDLKARVAPDGSTPVQ